MSLYSIIREIEEFGDLLEDQQMREFKDLCMRNESQKLESLLKRTLEQLHSYQITESSQLLTQAQFANILKLYRKRFYFTPNCNRLDIQNVALKWNGTKTTGIHLSLFKQLLLRSLESASALGLYYLNEAERSYAYDTFKEMTPTAFNKLYEDAFIRKPDNCVTCAYSGVRSSGLFEKKKSRGIANIILNADGVELMNCDEFAVAYDYWVGQYGWLTTVPIIAL